MAERLITMQELVGRPARGDQPAEPGLIPVSKPTIWRWVRQGSFPAPLKIGEVRVGWRESDIDLWLAARPSVKYKPGKQE